MSIMILKKFMITNEKTGIIERIKSLKIEGLFPSKSTIFNKNIFFQIVCHPIKYAKTTKYKKQAINCLKIASNQGLQIENKLKNIENTNTKSMQIIIKSLK